MLDQNRPWRKASDVAYRGNVEAPQSSAKTPEEQMMEAEFAKIMADTEGRAGELKADTGYGGVGDFLRGVVGGQNVPYSPESVNAMQSQFGRGSSAAEAAQMAALRESMGASGGSIYDPSYQAAARQAMGTRQGQNLDYAGQLAADASVRNNSAQMQAAGQVGSLDANRQAQINALLGQGAQYRSQQSSTTNTGNRGVQLPAPTSNINTRPPDKFGSVFAGSPSIFQEPTVGWGQSNNDTGVTSQQLKQRVPYQQPQYQPINYQIQQRQNAVSAQPMSRR